MTGIRFCTNCGRALGEQDVFCNNCGKEAFSQAAQPIPLPIPPPPPPPNHGLILIAVALVALLILAGVGYALITGWEDPGAEYQTGYGTESFSWSYDHIRYTLLVDIPLADYQYYVDDPIDRGLSSYNDDSLAAEYVTTQDATVMQIAQQMDQIATEQDMDDLDTIDCVLRFVQAINYTYDIDSVGVEEYWRFPVETLHDHTGDCEDKSFLFASIIEVMGYDAIIIIYEDHVAVGVACSNAPGTYYELSGVNYYYCETTAIGWNMGQIPDDRDSAVLIQVS
jgi:hypothetical protein